MQTPTPTTPATTATDHRVELRNHGRLLATATKQADGTWALREHGARHGKTGLTTEEMHLEMAWWASTTTAQIAGTLADDGTYRPIGS